jgi:hypothetical protein
MTLDTTIIGKAVDKKYSEFSDSIKAELYRKMTNNPDAVKYRTDYDNIQSMRQKFAEINGQSEE